MGVTFLAPAGTYTSPAKLVTKEISANGTYDASDDNANGYSAVTVNVEGGVSDFSTANVTFSSATFQTDFNAIMIAEGEGQEMELMYDTAIFGGATGDKTFNLVLYNGHQIVILPEGKTATASGSASIEDYYILITGDCTITIS